jgi:hypothetical protein
MIRPGARTDVCSIAHRNAAVEPGLSPENHGRRAAWRYSHHTRPGVIKVPSSALSALARAITSWDRKGRRRDLVQRVGLRTPGSAPRRREDPDDALRVRGLDKLALLKIALCNAPVSRSASACRTSRLRASGMGLPVEHVADFPSKGFRGERFIQERDPGIEDPVPDDRLLGVPGHVNHLQRRPLLDEALR